MMDLARVAFTGKLASMTRQEAAKRVGDAGGAISSTIGRDTTMLVVGMDGWPLLADGSVSQKLTRAQRLAQQGAGINIVSEERFLERLGLKSQTRNFHKTYTAEQICDLVGIDPEQLRRLEYSGLIHSSDGQFDFQDIVSLKTIVELVARGIKHHTIARSIAQLSNILPGTDRPLAQLKLVGEPSGKLLAEVEGVLMEPCGQTRLNFDRRSDAADAALVNRRIKEFDAEELFSIAVDLEEEGRFVEAERTYRQAIAQEPSMAAGHFNLSNVLVALNRPEAAKERLHVALEHDPNFETAWFNLACLQESSGQLDDAIKSLSRAVSIDPHYADAHFNLASCYERVGQLANAAHHWNEYLRLDNTSPWAEQARRKLHQA